MGERAILYCTEDNSDIEEYLEVVVENFPIVPEGTMVSIMDGDTHILEGQISFYNVRAEGLEVDLGEVISPVYQALRRKCREVPGHHRKRYDKVIIIGV